GDPGGVYRRGDRRGDLRRDGDGGRGGVESRGAGAAVPGRASGGVEASRASRSWLVLQGGAEWCKTAPRMARLSSLFAPTLRDDPADAEVVSHKLMGRAGMIRQVARGIYDLLPLGLRAVRRGGARWPAGSGR